MPLLLIKDGYTLDHTIPAKGRIPALAFKYRPALAEEIEQWRIDAANARTGKEKAKVEASFIASHVVSWDDAENKPEVAIITQLPPYTRSELFSAIVGGLTDDDEKK